MTETANFLYKHCAECGIKISYKRIRCSDCQAKIKNKDERKSGSSKVFVG